MTALRRSGTGMAYGRALQGTVSVCFSIGCQGQVEDLPWHQSLQKHPEALGCLEHLGALEYPELLEILERP